MTALQVCNFWQAIHGPLNNRQKNDFLEREVLKRIIEYPRFDVEEAVRRNRRLTDAHKDLQTGRFRRPLSTSQKKLSADKRIKEPTKTERLLWSRLINRKLDGYLFERESEIHGWYVDFFCLEGRLVVEIDGSSHRSRRADDSIRDDVMRANGYQVVRFSTDDVERRIETVVAKIRHQLPVAPSTKAKRSGKTAQTMPSLSGPKPTKKPSARKAKSRTGTVSSDSLRGQPNPAAGRATLTKGLVYCAGCIKTYVGTFRSDSGLGRCRGCGNVPVALCRSCKRQIFGDEGTFRCKLCDPSIREIARDAAGPGSQHPTNNLRSARRGKRVR